MKPSVSLSDRCHGRWHGILTALGVEAKVLSRKNQPCPMCGGRDRFRWTNHNDGGGYFCSGCGSGDGVKLVQELFALDFKGAAQKIETVIGRIDLDARPKRTEDQTRAAMRAVWGAGHAIRHDDPVGMYLANRLPILTSYPKCLRYVPNLRHEDGSAPAMIAQILTPDGKAANVHRTWLTADGHKADLAVCRKVMAGQIPDGSAIRLGAAGATLGIGEGIETSLAAGLRFDVPVWAVISEGGMRKFRPPECVERLLIFGDNDVSFVGQAAAFSAACEIGKAVRKAGRHITIDVLIPPSPGTDWADIPQIDTNRKDAA